MQPHVVRGVLSQTARSCSVNAQDTILSDTYHQIAHSDCPAKDCNAINDTTLSISVESRT